jgi:para-aminobenzoate synthetase / 4-amino-4-deoxychorismate lyase
MPIARFDSAFPERTGWHVRFTRARAVHVARAPAEVRPLLRAVEDETSRGRWAAVVLAYEAAIAFDAAHRVHGLPACPLAWAAIFDAPDPGEPHDEARTQAWRANRHHDDGGRQDDTRHPAPTAHFEPLLDRAAFSERVASVQAHIAAGDTYQVNLTFPMQGRAPADTMHWYDALRDAQQAGYCARLDLGDHLVISLSPELFFERRGALVRVRPMKGTAARGRWLAEDEAAGTALAQSEKARAENVMIVDLLRNDLGRVATTGTVHVPHLFTAERYPTLWQLTSTVEAQVPRERTLGELLGALFPCGSITGAPKVRTMEIIAAHEPSARGVYTGAIGLVRPGGDCTFSVAIRTIVVDRRTGEATLGVGAGITADSVGAEEYDECLLKAAFAAGASHPVARAHARAASREFSLLETMRLSDGVFVREARHLRRMQDSAGYFGFCRDEAAVRGCLARVRRAHPSGEWRVRLLVAADGTPTAECDPLDLPERPLRVALADQAVDSRDPFLCNKTTVREVYDAARARRSDVDDVILWNEAGELTESTIANLVVEIHGAACTPPLDCGLLGGVARAELLDAGTIVERRLTREDLGRATGVWLVNSLRGRIAIELVD